MRIRTLWVSYNDSDDSLDLMPNCELAVDEYLDDENPDFWRSESARLTQQAEDQGYRWRIIDLELPESVVRDAFEIPTVAVGVRHG